ncbi:type I-F CRISPR-associated protein Csy2 [Zobellella aerophila]|uniref:type I-F CRISPR-associated protein Csy2 n=1 Tax=Zobellella aerophila TaxID=870480 RepID=UPI0031E5AABC
MHLRDVLNIQDIQERNGKLRQSFASLAPWLETVGEEKSALVTLLNLTRRRAENVDLCDEQSATEALADSAHLSRCIETVRWQHSHNLKYPDTRVHGQRLVAPSPTLISGLVTSAGIDVHLGWTHNSANINHAKLFSGAFRYKGVVTNLALLLSAGVKVWLKSLVELGLSKLDVEVVIEEVKKQTEVSLCPESVSPYSKQLRFPLDDSQGTPRYLSFTPVISDSLVAEIQRAASSKKARVTYLNHARSASIGDLAAARGGRLAVLFYPPPVWRSERAFFSQSRKKLGDALFDHSAILGDSARRAMAAIIRQDRLLSHQQARQVRERALQVLRRQLAYWLAPVIEWRDELSNSSELARDDAVVSLAQRLATIPLPRLPELSGELAAAVHEALQGHRKGRPYAYHPDLVIVLKNEINWLLQRLSDQTPLASTTSSTCYVHMSGLRVYEALALSGPYICGLPSLTALGGMVHQFQRRLSQQLGAEVKIQGAAWFLRQYSLNAGSNLPEPDHVAKRVKISPVVRPGITETRTCDMVMDLVVAIQTGSHLESVSQLMAALPSRFAGGTMLPPALYEQSQWCHLYHDTGELFSILSRLPRNGRWIYPVKTEVCSLDGMLEEMASESSMRLVNLGYVGLHKPGQRDGALEPMHCYAEPAMGLVQCRDPVSVRLKGCFDFLSSAFWRLNCQDGTMIMVRSDVSAEPQYHDNM